MDVVRLSAFSDGTVGGNPAGVLIGSALPSIEDMQMIAAEVGYSETAFAAPQGDQWRVRYFAPESEVPFCGHATIALGAALAERVGNGKFSLILNDAEISVVGAKGVDGYEATLSSPPTRSGPADPQLVEAALNLFGYEKSDLDERIPPALAAAGAQFLVIALKQRDRLRDMSYDLDVGKKLMRDAGIITIDLVHAEADQLFHARNPFASGGVYEDPATGAACAAFCGYLRDLGWPHGGRIEVIQGEDMGMRSRLFAEIDATPGNPIQVSGAVRVITE
ncbi:MAG: PhzF family phenazine biosynthesis protein [Pseudomonadota bacterium]